MFERILNEGPKDVARWSIWTKAAETDLSHTTTRAICTAFSLPPQRGETSNLSTIPLYVDKFQGLVGQYVSPQNRKPSPTFAASPTSTHIS